MSHQATQVSRQHRQEVAWILGETFSVTLFHYRVWHILGHSNFSKGRLFQDKLDKDNQRQPRHYLMSLNYLENIHCRNFNVAGALNASARSRWCEVESSERRRGDESVSTTPSSPSKSRCCSPGWKKTALKRTLPSTHCHPLLSLSLLSWLLPEMTIRRPRPIDVTLQV